jgi:hypothetical protein
MLVGTARCAVPARVQRAERIPGTVRFILYVAPLNAARTAQRAIPGGIQMRLPDADPLTRPDFVLHPETADQRLPRNFLG